MRLKTAKHTSFKISEKFERAELTLLSSRATISQADTTFLSSEQVSRFTRLNPIIGYRKSSQPYVSVVYGFHQLELFAILPKKEYVTVPYIEIIEPPSISIFIEMELFRIVLSQVETKPYGALLDSYLSHVKTFAEISQKPFYKKTNFANFSGIDRRKLSLSIDTPDFTYKK